MNSLFDSFALVLAIVPVLLLAIGRWAPERHRTKVFIWGSVLVVVIPAVVMFHARETARKQSDAQTRALDQKLETLLNQSNNKSRLKDVCTELVQLIRQAAQTGHADAATRAAQLLTELSRLRGIVETVSLRTQMPHAPTCLGTGSPVVTSSSPCPSRDEPRASASDTQHAATETGTSQDVKPLAAQQTPATPLQITITNPQPANQQPVTGHEYVLSVNFKRGDDHHYVSRSTGCIQMIGAPGETTHLHYVLLYNGTVLKSDTGWLSAAVKLKPASYTLIVESEALSELARFTVPVQAKQITTVEIH